MNRKVKSMVHSTNQIETVTLLHEDGPNDCLVMRGRKVCTAIYNPFVGLYYTDDVYGVIADADQEAGP